MADKLNIIIPELDVTEATKADLMSALKDKGKDINENVPLSSYPDYIKSIKPGVGVAQPNQVLNGVEFTNQSGNPLTGTIPVIPGKTFKMEVTDQTIPGNTYIDGKQIFETDANIKAENIVAGKSIAGVTGTMATNAGLKIKHFSSTQASGTVSFNRPVLIYAVLMGSTSYWSAKKHTTLNSPRYTSKFAIGNIFEMIVEVRGKYESSENYCSASVDTYTTIPFVEGNTQKVSKMHCAAFDPAANDRNRRYYAIENSISSISAESSFSYYIDDDRDYDIEAVEFDLVYKEVE